MDKKGIGSLSASDSFYFQLVPNYFKVEHGFAKTMRPNTNYRLSIFKGIQKADEMPDSIKGKLVGGKILFDQNPLNFYLPLYNPTRNIEFSLKVLETKPNESQAEIATYKLKSGDFIKKFLNEGSYYSKEEVPLIENLSLVFELFVHNSKLQLDKIIKGHQQKAKVDSRNSIATNRGKTPKKNEATSEVHSQSDNMSDTGSRDGGIFASKRKLTRKRGHDGKLRSKHGSRENSEAGSSRSRSSRKSFGPFPHNEQNQHFIHSPKKVSPPKVDEHSGSPPKPKAEGKKENLVVVGRKDSQNSYRGDKNVGTPRTKGNEPQTERAESARKSEIYSRSDRNSVSGQKGVHDLEIKTSQNMFDIEKRIDRSKNSSSSKPKEPKNESKPPLPIKKNDERLRVPEEAHSGEQEPISKPSEVKEKIDSPLKAEEGPKIIVAEQKKAEFGENSVKSKGKAPSIAVKQRHLVDPDQHTASQIKMKTSIHLSANQKNEEETEQAAGKEYSGMKDTFFYVAFTLISVLLFWNAITPSRRV